MTANIIKDMDSRMRNSLATLKEELATLRTGRASTSLLDHVQVEVYGSSMPINQVASVNVPEARMLTVQPWDKGTLKIIEKAIRDSDLGLNPINDGQLLRVPLPELTEDRRRDLVKLVHKYGEQCKIAVRNVRRDALDSFKKQEKNKEISQDTLHMEEKKVQEHTDRFIKEIDDLVAAKEADVMHV